MLYAKPCGGRRGVGSASSSAPHGASPGPTPSCWGSPSKVDELKLAGFTKSRQSRTSREQELAVPEQWVLRKGERR